LGIKNTGPKRKSSLKVVHKYGPCSHLHEDKATTPTHAEILQHDEARVKSIHSRLSKMLAGSGGDDLRDVEASADIPAKSGSTIGSGNYVVTVGLGTPKKDLTSLGPNVSLAPKLATNKRNQSSTHQHPTLTQMSRVAQIRALSSILPQVIQIISAL
jgi:hypothetical protein